MSGIKGEKYSLHNESEFGPVFLQAQILKKVKCINIHIDITNLNLLNTEPKDDALM